MPIGGFVVTVVPGRKDEVKARLSSVKGCDVYEEEATPGNERQNDAQIVITLDTETSDAMEALVEELKGIEGVITVDLAYLNVEDEVVR